MSFFLGVIPARGNSKRLPRKNVRIVAGKPLIAWTIQAARASELDAWFISTDSRDIASIATSYEGAVPFIRPDYLATDEAKTIDVLRHAVMWFEMNFDRIKVTHVVTLQPTSPLRTWQHIDIGLMMIDHAQKDSLVTLDDYEKPNGCLYITKRDMLMDDHRIWDKSGVMWVQMGPMPDIDDEEDLLEAEKLLCQRRS